MLKTAEIVSKLPATHKAGVLSILESDKVFASTCIYVFDQYSSGNHAEDINEELDLTLQEFKIVERLIYRAILSFYNLKDQSIVDLLPTTLFYALNSNKERSEQEKKDLFQQLFHQMRQYKIDEEALPLVQSLSTLFEKTQLRGVYSELIKYYTQTKTNNFEVIRLFESFNDIYPTEDIPMNAEMVREQIAIFRIIRKLASKHPSPTTDAICDLCKLLLLVKSKQPQILKDGNWTLEALMKCCSEKINGLAFGIKRFYLQNIYKQLAAVVHRGKILISPINNTAHNFGFPAVVKKVEDNKIKTLKTDPQLTVYGNNLTVRVINEGLNRTANAFNLYYLKSLRLSHPIQFG